jgi:serine/threonine protein phosphatase PrpC
MHEEFDPDEPSEPSHVLAAIRRANAAVRELTAWAGGSRVIAGTTLTGVALVVEHPNDVPRWMVFNLGDSRVYRWDAASRIRRLERVSVDHSLVQELVDAGLIDEQRALTHPDRNIITRALGASDRVEVDSWLLPADRPQTFLICSDGLTKELGDEQISAVLEAASDPGSAVELLLEAALVAGGHDNITIVMVRSEYHDGRAGGVGGTVDEQTRDRALSPELEDTRPRV